MTVGSASSGGRDTNGTFVGEAEKAEVADNAVFQSMLRNLLFLKGAWSWGLT